MNLAARIRRAAALAIALTLTVGALTFAPAPEEAQAASNAKDGAKVLSLLNTKRAKLGINKLKSNPALTAYAQAWAESASRGQWEYSELYSPPADGATGVTPLIAADRDIILGDQDFVVVSRPSLIVWGMTAESFGTVWSKRGYTHGAVGVITGKSTWYVMVVAKYTGCAPLTLRSTAPTIAGTGRAGELLTARTGTWSPSSGVRHRYEWRVDGTIVGDATKYYRPVTADVGKRVSVSVEGTRKCYVTPAVKTSAARKITAANVPVVSGDHNVGSSLTVDVGTWPREGSVLSYDWLANGQPVEGERADAHSATLLLAPSELGARVTVRVTATAPGYSAQKTSLSSVAAAPALLVTRPTPVVSGVPLPGETLTATPGTWAPGPVALTYAWRVNSVTVLAQTGPTFVVPPTAAGKSVAVTVTGSRTGYAPSAITSSPVAVDARVFSATPAPVISGYTKVGNTLKVTVPAWTASATYTYQWLRNGKKINGATAATYKLASANKKKSVTVRVVGKHAGFVPVTVVSDPVTIR